MKHPEWFAFVDTDDLVPLGRHETFFEADEAAPGNCVWLFRDDTLRGLKLRIEHLLDTPEGLNA